jgi:tetratricopeptide (TPR) repeat protein
MQADEVNANELTAASAAPEPQQSPPEAPAATIEEAVKTCCICGLDVSHKPRHRGHVGRYWCAHCYVFIPPADKSAASTPCPDCARESRQMVMVEQAGERVCPSCNQAYLAECANRLLHKAAVTANPEIDIRKLIQHLAKGIAGLAIVASLLTLYHFGLLYVHPKTWVPFESAICTFGIVAVGLGIAIGIQYLRIELRKRARKEAYDKMVQSAANQILAIDDESHTMGVSEPPEPLRRRAERAVARVEACAGQGISGAGEIVQSLAEKGDPGPLTEFLRAQRPDTIDTVARNREIATISYLTRDLATASAAVTAILLRIPHDQEAMTRQALICFQTGELEQSKKIFRRVVHVARERKSEIDLAAAYCNLGMLHVMLEEYDDADVRYSQAMQIYKRLSREEGQADCLVNLGLITYKKKKGAEAEPQFRAALAINKHRKRREGQSICCTLLGVILLEKAVPELREAEKLLNQAVHLNLELGRPGGVATAYGNLGLVRVKRGDLAGARELFLKAQSIYQRINRPKLVAKIQGMLKTVGTMSNAKAGKSLASRKY